MQPPTLYLVGTAAAADTLRGRLAEAEAIHATLGTVAPIAEVVVVATAAEEQRLQRAIAEHDLIRGGLGLPPAQVIDLRGQS